MTWRELEQRSRRCAAALLAAGLRTGDVVAVFLENHPRYFELLWAAHRIGLYYTTISRHLKREEAQYIIADCDARVLFHSSHTQAELDPARLDAAGVIRISMDGAVAGAADYEDWLARQSEDASLPDTPEGTDFLYSSGTTGLPKGIKRPLAQANRYFRVGEAPSSAWKAFGPDTVYLSTAPFYHAAPVRWNMAVLRAGGSCVMLESSTPPPRWRRSPRTGSRIRNGCRPCSSGCCACRTRNARAMTCPRCAVHAAAPCPAEVKQAMIRWWGRSCTSTTAAPSWSGAPR